MSRTVALSQLRTDVRTKGDFGGATVRHTDTQLNRYINQSIQAFRERISDDGSQHYLVSATGTLGVGPTSPYPFYQLDLSGVSPALVRTYGIDITFSGGRVVTLDHVPFDQRAKYGTTNQGGTPQAWAHINTDQVAILPASNTAYTYVVWYLPKFTDLSADGDTFDGVAGWEEWVVWDVVAQVIARDQFPQAFAIAEARRAEVEARVIRGATKVTQAGGAHVGRDTFGGKLTHFLGGRNQPRAIGGGPVVPAANSVTNAMLADMTGPTVKGRPSGAGPPIDWAVPTLTQFLSEFSSLYQGVVPASGGEATDFLRADGVWAAPPGGAGGGSPGAPTGSIQFNQGSGVFGGSSGFMFTPGTGMYIADPIWQPTGWIGLGATGGPQIPQARLNAASGMFGITIGPDVARPDVILDNPSPEGLGSNLRFRSFDLNGLGKPREWLGIDRGLGAATGTLDVYVGHPTETQDAALRAIRTVRLETSFSGTIESRINNKVGLRVSASGVFAPSGAFNVGALPIRAPTGITQTSFLRDDGEWAAPVGSTDPGGSDGNIQYNSSGAFEGATGVQIGTSNGGGLVFGSPAVVDAAGVTGSIRVATQFSMQGRTPSGSRQTMFLWSPVNNSMELGSPSGTVNTLRYIVPTGGSHTWRMGVSGVEMRLRPTGLHATDFHFAIKSLSVSSGIPNDQLSPMASGTVKGQLGADGIAQDIPLASLTTALYLFDSTNRGTVPASDGAATSFLAGDGVWRAPSGAHQFPPVAGATNAQLASMASGTVKGQLDAAGVPVDVPLPSLTAALYLFDSTNRGVVPGSGGGTTAFLRADGTWDVPPGTGGEAAPGGGTSNIQFRDAAGTFGGASGILAVASGSALQLGGPTAASVGWIRGGQTMSVYGMHPSLTDVRMLGMGTGAVELGQSGIAAKVYGDFSAQNLTLASGLADSSLAPMGSGTVKGSLTGTGTPSDISIPTLHAFAPTFTSARPGTVPASDGAATSFLAGDGSWIAPSGAHQFPPAAGATNAQLAVMSTGTVKANLSGNATPSDVPLATLLAFAPTFTSTRAGIVPESGGGTTNFLSAAGTWIAPSGAHQFPPAAGATNAQLASMSTGTIKGNLAGTNVPADVPFATFMAFAPTFTAARMGVVPASGGGSTNFLRADGTWDVPPGAAASPGAQLGAVQYNNGVGFGGASGVNIVASGVALGFGPASGMPSVGDVRVASGWNVTGRLPSGSNQSLFDWSGGGASGTLKVGGASGVMGTVRSEVATGGAFEWLVGGQTGAKLSGTGIAAPNLHISAKSLDVDHIKGLPVDQNALKRFSTNLITNAQTGLPSGLSLYAPRGAASGANRFIIPSGTVPAARTITLRPTGARAGEVMRIERVDASAFAVSIANPTGTVLHVMPSGTKSTADFFFTKPSGPNFELGGHADLF